MKLFKIIAKNFKILMRSKASAFVVIVGPLLIIGLISLALSNTQDYSLTIGVISHGGDLSDQFISELKEAGYSVIDYDNMDTCVQNVKTQTTNICVGLPENFKVEDGKTNNIKFYVDQSRVNIVETVVSSVSNTLGGQSDEIALSLTQKLLDSINHAHEELTKEKVAIESIKEKTITIEDNSQTIEDRAKNSDLSGTANKFSEADTALDNIDLSTDSINNGTDDLLNDLKILLNTLDNDPDYQSSSKVNKVQDGYDNLDTLTAEETTSIKNNSQKVKDILNNAQTAVSAASEDLSVINDRVAEVNDDISEVQTQAEIIAASVESAQDKINSLEITSANSIVSPFSIAINPISSNSNRSTFMFPYFLMLVVLFVGIMLASTLVVMEKKSKAAFRTFMTPTNTTFYIIGRYITNLVIVAGQLLIILLVAVNYLDIPFRENIFTTLLILFLSVSFFLFLGSFIGHVFRKQEGTTIASVSIGSLFLFLSNVVLPVESYPPIIKKIIGANPYMLSSELLKQSMLFNVNISALKGGIFALLVYLVVAITLVFVAQKLSYSRLFNSFGNKKILQRPHIRNDNSFVTDKGLMLKSKVDLYKALWQISDKEYTIYNKELCLWVKDTFKDRKLSQLMKKSDSKEMAIKALELAVGVDEVEKKSTNKKLFGKK